MNKRLHALAAVAAATALVAPAAGADTPEVRRQTLEYAAGGFSAGPGQTTVLTVGDSIGKVVFRGGPENVVSIEVADAHGLPVAAIVSQGDNKPAHHICGKSERPLPIAPYRRVTVFLVNGACGHSAASVVTTGAVTATFGTRR